MATRMCNGRGGVRDGEAEEWNRVIKEEEDGSDRHEENKDGKGEAGKGRTLGGCAKDPPSKTRTRAVSIAETARVEGHEIWKALNPKPLNPKPL